MEKTEKNEKKKMSIWKKLIIAALVIIGLIVLASVIYLVYLFITVVIPMIPSLFWSMLK